MKGLIRSAAFGVMLVLWSTATAQVPSKKAPVPVILPPLEKASWIWEDSTNSQCHLRKVFTLTNAIRTATVLITADNGYELYVNGSLVGKEIGAAGEIWQSVERYDITRRLTKGRNIIGIRGVDLGGIRGVIASVRLEIKKQATVEFGTDATWSAAGEGQPVDYSHPEFVEGPEWRSAKVVGPFGMAPWGKVAWSQETEKVREAQRIAQPDSNFAWPEEVAFIGDDCSAYVPQRGDAWGVVFRVGDWSRAYTEFDLPCPSKIGRKLYALKPGRETKPRVLLDAGAGVIGSPAVSYDGRSLLLTMAPAGEKFFHIYRLPLTGGKPERLTDGPFHDIDPVELPDGRIAFTSTRIGTFEEYHQPPSRALFRMNADGSDIHPISSTLIFDNEPKVMADGRLIFIRSDNFFDRGKVETHLHAMRPDGTDGLTEFGANVGPDYGVRLRAFGYGSPAPLPNGKVAFISRGGNFIGTPGQHESSFQRLPDMLGDLAPMPDGRLLCTVFGRSVGSDVLGVIDPSDCRVVSIFESEIGGIHSPVFLGAHPRPPVIPEYATRNKTNEVGATGFLFCQDARVTTKTKADWENIRAVRVVGALPLTTRSSHSHIVHVGHETVELGTVPLAPDGSFFAEVPADMPIALQAVDGEGRSELNEMSWLYVRPGERRSCVGCHNPRDSSPPLAAGNAEALRTPALKVLGQGNPHHSRGNNPGVTGMMDLQFDRFREAASLNRYNAVSDPDACGDDDVKALLRHLESSDDSLKISAAQRLAVFKSREGATALAGALNATNREVRVAAAMALAACGTRESVPPLLSALEDKDRVVAQAAAVALENLTAHSEIFRSHSLDGLKERAQAWRKWFAETPWDKIDRDLAEKVRGTNQSLRRAVVAIGHVGGESAATALRDFVKAAAGKNPYPVFERDNRTDLFTFSADSPWNPRLLQEAVRALGYLRDTNSLPVLWELLAKNIEPRTGNLFLAEAVIEALGCIGNPEAEKVLIETFAALKDYWHYVGWYSDHPALYACHSSPLHARIIESLNLIGSKSAGDIVPQLIGSVPTDPDRGLFLGNDDYETLVGRLIRRSGRGADVIETCLAILGDSQATPNEKIKSAISRTHAAWAGHPGPENRAAQILSLVCRDGAHEPRVRAAFERFVARPEEPVQRSLGNPNWTPVRHWVLFYLGRTLGQLADVKSVDTLTGVLADRLNEARHGRPDPSQPDIHFLHLEYTPCWRAAAAWALGRIGDARAGSALLQAVANLDNATDVRHAAANALGAIADPSTLSALKQLAAGYPEVSTRRALLMACARIESSKTNPQQVAQQTP